MYIPIFHKDLRLFVTGALVSHCEIDGIFRRVEFITAREEGD
jgi:hypothetical protein